MALTSQSPKIAQAPRSHFCVQYRTPDTCFELELTASLEFHRFGLGWIARYGDDEHVVSCMIPPLLLPSVLAGTAVGEALSVGRHGNELSGLFDLSALQFGKGKAHSIRCPFEHPPPGVAYKRIAKAIALSPVSGRIGAPLATSHEIGLKLDGTCAAEDIPVVSPGFGGERGRQDHNVDALMRQLPEEI